MVKSTEEDSLFVITQRGREFLDIYQSLLLTFGATEPQEFDMKVSSLHA
jgi:hypothetical protein